MYINIQGLCPQTVPSKVPYLEGLAESRPLFFGLSETWLNQSYLAAELEVEGYTIFRKDSSRQKSRRGRQAGGVALYVRDDMACSFEPIYSYSSNAIQILSLYSKKENMVLCVIYRQPDDKAHGHPSTPGDFQIGLTGMKESILGLDGPSPDIIFGGDFNLPHIRWPDGSPSTGASSDEKSMSESLEELSNDLLLHQIITKGTHKDGNTLDLIFVNNLDLIHEYTVSPTLHTITHHCLLQVFTQYKVESCPADNVHPPLSSYRALNFFDENIDWDGLNKYIESVDWRRELRKRNATEMLKTFYRICNEAADKFIPAKLKHKLFAKSTTTRYRRNLTRKRRRIHKILSKVTSQNRKDKLTLELIQIEKDLQRSYKNSKDYNEQKALDAIKSNSKYFYSYVKKKSKIKSKIGPLLNEENELTGDAKSMAEILTAQYSKVFSKPMDADTSVPRQQSKKTIPDLRFTKEDIIAAIDELKNTAAPGPDGFPAIFLKKCKETLATPLYILWTFCLDRGIIPSDLKHGIITPLHKGGSRSVAANYRPVALTSHLIKIFEKIVRNHITAFFEENDLFNSSQHGFRAGRSCLSQLLEHFDSILDHLLTGDNVDVVYLDFAKAFDKVDFEIVLRKAELMGIKGNTLEFLRAFLKDRTQSVVVNGVESNPSPVLSGVPQGSVLGPLIFLIHIGDIDADILTSIVRSFADDTRCTRNIRTMKDISDLQEDVDRLYEWTLKSNMKLNDGKFEILRYGPDGVLKLCTSYLTPSGSIITEKQNLRDLGVTMSNDCRFDDHIAKIIESCKSMIAWILRSFNTRKKDHMLLLWKTYVLPTLEYCSVLWCPLKTGLIQKIDALQWSFLRKMHMERRQNYWQILRTLNLYSTQRRRERYRIIYVWKIIEQIVPNVNGSVQCYQHIRHGRKCKVNMVRGQSSLIRNLKEASFTIHGPQLFNVLPKWIRNITGVSVDKFKDKLDEFLQTIPDEPQIIGYTAIRRADSNSIIDMVKLRPSAQGLAYTADP